MNASYNSSRMAAGDPAYQSSQSSNTSHSQSVGFKVNQAGYGASDERVKYLTAKYPKHQMSLIRKRIAAENWMDEELKKLYSTEDESYDCEIDLDDLLDLEEVDRPQFIKERVQNSGKSPEVIDKFVADLLQKAQTL